MIELTDLFSGDWLIPDGKDTYSKAYPGLFVSQWSGGVTWRTTREIAEQVVEDNDEPTWENSDKFAWVHDSLVMYSQVDDGFRVIDPDEDGLYEMPGWSWAMLDAKDRITAQVIVGAAATPVAPDEHGNRHVELTVRLHFPDRFFRVDQMLTDEALWGRWAQKLTVPGVGVSDWRVKDVTPTPEEHT